MADARPRKRERAIKACIHCRQMKKKCDGERPCSSCARFNHDCQYYQQKGQSPLKPIARTATGGEPVGNTLSKGTPNLTPITPTGLERGDNFMDYSILDPEKGRYLDGSSAIAFPRLMGIHFGATKAPRLHSFAWNLGIRSEPQPNTLDITQFVSLNDVHIYSNEYFMVVHPSFDFLDQQDFIRRASLRWKENPTEDALNFDAVICGVVALGYFVSRKTDNGIEAALTSLAKDRLESVALTKPPTIDLIAAWILRAIYLRATSRPHASWMASNILMHLIESSGIQHDISSVAIIYPSCKSTNIIDPAQCLYRRKVFWVGRAINAIFSYEYSRPRINIDRVSCARIDTEVKSATRDLLRLADMIPENSQACTHAEEIVQTRHMLDALEAGRDAEVPVSLFRADLAFAAYRHLRPFLTSTNSTTDPKIVSNILSIGLAALKAIEGHLSKPLAPPAPSSHSTDDSVITPWWSLASIPFHFILILLSLDTPESLSRVSTALGTLQAIKRAFNTHLTREAVQNAAMLIHLAQSRKELDVQALKGALNDNPCVQETGTAGLVPSGGDAAMAPISNGGTRIQQQSQPVGEQGIMEGLGLATHMNGSATGDMESVIMSDNLADINWDAVFRNTDWM
jgi:hypothetical protein